MNNTIKISELEEATQINDNDLIPFVDVANGETKKIKAQYVGTGQSGAEIPISDTEPLDPEEDDLWIDTSDEAGGTNILSTIFPIGSIVIKADNVDYSNWLGFTWERTLIGRVAVGIDSNDTDFDTIGETGGEKTHTLTVNEIPPHIHNGLNVTGIPLTVNGDGTGSFYSASINGYNVNGSTLYTEETGGGQAHNILQPYQVVAYWKRVA